jgi:hypothetical protein
MVLRTMYHVSTQMCRGAVEWNGTSPSVTATKPVRNRGPIVQTFRTNGLDKCSQRQLYSDCINCVVVSISIAVDLL